MSLPDSHTTQLNTAASVSSESTPELEQVGKDRRSNSRGTITNEGRGDADDSKAYYSKSDLDDRWEQDIRNPRNWSSWKKWRTVGIVSSYLFVSPLASAMMAPALPDIADHFHITSSTIVAMTLSIFLLTFAIGPLILGPLSEIYGRIWVLHIGNILFAAFNVACGYAPNTGVLLGMRLLCGFFGSAPMACGGSTISDLFAEKDRASAMAVFTLGTLVGPAIGPIAGGFITETIGFKYIFVVITALGAVASAIGLPFLHETYAPVLRMRLARRARERDVEKAGTAVTDIQAPEVQGHRLCFLWRNMSRPFVLLTRSAVCFVLSLYMAYMNGIYYLMTATFPALFQTRYGFSPGITGLCYIGLGLGFLAATFFGAYNADKIYHALSLRNSGQGKPEYRIPALIFGSLFVPVGLFWYGWSAEAKIHWIMPIIGTTIYGFGMMTTFLPIQLYLVDAFAYAASALAASSVFRSMLGFVFPLFGQQMYNALGYGGGNSLLAGLAVVIGIPFPVWLYFHGENLRQRSSLGL